MLASPLVTLIIPLFNHSSYLEHSLDSILKEGWKRLEIIIRDDCSTDNSLQIARDWVANNNHHFESAEVIAGTSNIGISRSLNLMIAQARGDYICPIASDDALVPNGIATRIRHLEDNPHLLAVFSDAEVITDNNQLIDKSALFGHYKSNKRYLINPATIRMEMLHRWSVPGPVILYRKDSFDTEKGVGLYDESLQVEDRDIYLRLLEKNALGFVDETVAQYRLHSSNAILDPATKERRTIDQVTPLLRIATSDNLSMLERFVAKHIAIGLVTKNEADNSSNLLIKLIRRIQTFIHKKPARIIAKTYCAITVNSRQIS